MSCFDIKNIKYPGIKEIFAHSDKSLAEEIIDFVINNQNLTLINRNHSLLIQKVPNSQDIPVEYHLSTHKLIIRYDKNIDRELYISYLAIEFEYWKQYQLYMEDIYSNCDRTIFKKEFNHKLIKEIPDFKDLVKDNDMLPLEFFNLNYFNNVGFKKYHKFLTDAPNVYLYMTKLLTMIYVSKLNKSLFEETKKETSFKIESAINVD